MNRASDDRMVTLDIASRYEMLDLVQSVLLQCCTLVGFEDDATHYMSVAVRESVVNAIKHGNRQDEAKRVEVEFVLNARSLGVSVRDQGQGFSPESVPDPLAPENLLKTAGRGISLVRVAGDDRGLEAGHRGRRQSAGREGALRPGNRHAVP